MAEGSRNGPSPRIDTALITGLWQYKLLRECSHDRVEADSKRFLSNLVE